MNCGWLPADEWPDKEPRGTPFYLSADVEQLHPVCPGYSIQLPIVLEAYTALNWRESGSLRDLYDVPPTDLLRTCINIASNSKSAVEAHILNEAKRAAKK